MACHVSIGDDVERMIEEKRSSVAFTMGAMGSATTNFYNDAFKRAGFTDDAEAIQELWLQGKRPEAAARVPDDMVTQFGALGTPDMVLERFRKYRAAGVNSLSLRFDEVGSAEKIGLLEQVLDLTRQV